MAYEYTLTAVIPASARDIYDAWLDSAAHSKMTGGQARASAELGAQIMAWDGYISGRNLELTPGERIVQAWRTTKFPEDHEDSIITLTFEERDDGTLLTLSHSNVPEGHLGYEQGGWQKSYFEPMIAYFSNLPNEFSASGEAEQEPQSEPESRAAAEERAPGRVAHRPAPQARVKRPAAKKTAVAPKARSKNAAAKNKKKATAPKGRPKGASARKMAGAGKKALAQKPQRKRATATAKPKPKQAAAKGRAKSKVRAKARARPAPSARRRSAGSRPRPRGVGR
ncbi:MAG TPA: SRPBCC domain-containing protein [Candidatus Udaeobacter sp.]|nr:SRPBCC domain-containing protein [Candidatus Udaeobacter sp.]